MLRVAGVQWIQWQLFSRNESESEKKVKVTLFCPTVRDPGILQARILQWVAVPFSRGSSQPRSNPGLLHCRWIFYQLSHQGSPSMVNCKLGSGRVDLALVLTNCVIRDKPIGLCERKVKGNWNMQLAKRLNWSRKWQPILPNCRRDPLGQVLFLPDTVFAAMTRACKDTCCFPRIPVSVLGEVIPTHRGLCCRTSGVLGDGCTWSPRKPAPVSEMCGVPHTKQD